MIYNNSSALEIARELQRDGPISASNLNAALINALLRIDTLEKQVETLSKDLARVALARRKYGYDGTLNKD